MPSPLTIVGIAAGVAALAAIVFGWLLLDAHEALGKAELKAQLNANTVKVLQDQETRNQKIDAKLETLATVRDTETREIIREIHVAPSSADCIKSPAMRALNGKLQYKPNVDGGRPAATSTPAQPVPSPGR